ncbi:Bbp19 family protein [Varunaivibrio sulfuroxidans]
MSTPDGEKVMAHLSAVTLDRALSPLAADSVLRHLEGQRQLVAHIKALMRRGRGL